jgi:hypothetical protein
MLDSVDQKHVDIKGPEKEKIVSILLRFLVEVFLSSSKIHA